MKYFKIKKNISENKFKPFIKVRLELKKPKFPRVIFWKFRS